MGYWKCPNGHTNDDRYNNCQQEGCEYSEGGRTSKRWWKDKYGHYNWENLLYCDTSGCDQTREDAVAWGS